MLHLFGRKTLDKKAAEAFWDWFENNEAWIIDTMRIDSSAVIDAIDARLMPIFPYFQRELEFQLGFNQGKGEFFFFHFADRALMRDGEILKSMMPEALAARWTFILEA